MHCICALPIVLFFFTRGKQRCQPQRLSGACKTATCVSGTVIFFFWDGDDQITHASQNLSTFCKDGEIHVKSMCQHICPG